MFESVFYLIKLTAIASTHVYIIARRRLVSVLNKLEFPEGDSDGEDHSLLFLQRKVSAFLLQLIEHVSLHHFLKRFTKQPLHSHYIACT